MRRTAWILTALAALALMTVLWQTFHQELVVTGRGLNAVDASERQGEHDALVSAIVNRQFSGFVYDGDPEAEDTRFVTYTLRLRNPGLLPAETVEMQLVTEAEDIAAWQTPLNADIAPGGEEILTMTLLTGSRGTLRRDLVITYYLWGRLYTMRYTLS